MKRIQHSQYNTGDVVMIKKDCGGLCKGHMFRILNPNKVGKSHAIHVEDLTGAHNMFIPSKYLAKVK